jgi:hypothetical protein
VTCRGRVGRSRPRPANKAIERLTEAMKVRSGGAPADWLVLAMAYYR